MPIPDGWEAAFQRAAACADPARPLTTVGVEDGTLSIHTESATGQCHDEITVDLKKDRKPFEVDPLHVLRVAPLVSEAQFNAEVLVLMKGPFAHFVSHCVK